MRSFGVGVGGIGGSIGSGTIGRGSGADVRTAVGSRTGLALLDAVAGTEDCGEANINGWTLTEREHLLRVGVQGRSLDISERMPAHLTFLVDVSGSMEGAGRLPLAPALASLPCASAPSHRAGPRRTTTRPPLRATRSDTSSSASSNTPSDSPAVSPSADTTARKHAAPSLSYPDTPVGPPIFSRLGCSFYGDNSLILLDISSCIAARWPVGSAAPGWGTWRDAGRGNRWVDGC